MPPSDPDLTRPAPAPERTPLATELPTTLTSPAAAGSIALPTVAGYEVSRELGRGGMGVVYLARQAGLGRAVALKMVLSGGLASPAELRRFRSEALAVAALSHPNIVQIYEVGEHDGRPFFSLEFCPGGTLSDRLRAGPATAEEAAAIVEAVARGVHAAHLAGVVHRDLKPANVLHASDGSYKVTDFGLAKRLDGEDELTRTGAVMGTPTYMAPEQARGDTRHVGPAADVYALGVILYECLTGRVPFRGDSHMQTLSSVIHDEPDPPRRLNPAVPRDLEAVCLQCLRKEPGERYPSAGELAEDLRRFLAGEPVQARSINLVGRFASAVGRSQHEAEFKQYGTLFFALAPVMLVPETITTLVAWNDWPEWLLPLVQTARLVAFLALVAVARRGQLLPRTGPERQLWSVGGGYLLACISAGVSNRVVLGWGAVVETRLYPSLACLTGLMFFALGAGFWGGCYVIGLAFFASAFVMTSEMRLAPLEFGLLWAVVLVVIGMRLRRRSG